MDCLIAIRPDGEVALVYDDAFQSLFGEGEAVIRRASHVEPTPDGCWQVDLAPVGGPVLPAHADRRSALHAERHWLETFVVAYLGTERN